MKIMKILSKVFRWIIGIGTLSILLFLLAYAWILPEVFKIRPYIVLSGSMEPTISTGAVAFIRISDREAEAGDIITFRLKETAEDGAAGEEGLLVTHRVVRKENGAYITKGDANDLEDFVPVEEEQVIGTYVGNIRGLGFFLRRLDYKRRLYGVVILVLVNLTAFLFSQAAEDCNPDEDPVQRKIKKEDLADPAVSVKKSE